jgi:prevent-host-death family protein
MSDIVNIHEAKTHLSRLLERVRRGATVTIAKAGTPVALLIPVARSASAARVRETVRAPAPAATDRGARLRRLLEQEVWPLVPQEQRGRALTRVEEDAILGYGPHGA